MAAKEVEYVAIAPGDPCLSVKIKGHPTEVNTYVDRGARKLALIQYMHDNEICLYLKERELK
jgi:hypothetical protein